MIKIKIFLSDVKRLVRFLGDYKMSIAILKWLFMIWIVESIFITKFINSCAEGNAVSADLLEILSLLRYYLHNIVMYLITLSLGFLLNPILRYLNDINAKMTNEEVHCRKRASMLRVELDKFYQKQCVNVASNSEWLEITRLFSRYLVCRYPLDSYFFNLFMEEVVEVGGEVSNDDLVLRLTETLSTWNKDKHVNIAFSIWYLISLLYKNK